MQQAFTQFTKDYNKQYEVAEVFKRFEIFQQNMQMIQEHNAKGEDWTMAMNEHGDLTWEEFSVQFKGFKGVRSSYLRSQNLHKPVKGETFADSLDWNSKGPRHHGRSTFQSIVFLHTNTRMKV